MAAGGAGGPILVFVEQVGGEVDRLSLEALAFAAPLAAAAAGARVEIVVLGSEAAASAGTLRDSGAALAHVVADARLDTYAPVAWAAALGAAMDRSSAVVVVAPGSDRGNEVLAHLAARRGLPMAAHVVSVAPAASWRLVRQRWAGSLLEDAALDAPVRLVSVAPHAVAPIEAGAGAGPPVEAQLFDADLHDADFDVRVGGIEASEADGVSLTDAKVVVGGGRGVGSAAGFGQLEELAGLLGGAVGGSRVVTSLGWRPHSDQIGQTGLRIAPDLYIACGISGAIQHIVGCKAAKRILAINTDPDSPIMSVADYAVIGDLGAVVPAISAELRRRAGAA
ncbi:MAG: electron transfer flavoprotein subunit alpha/FixB family protein [Chloroflexi bacterium]|nr:electron transfer flavoprotein subunit alpha/FixB family protein [Chloroflexota bacterium]